MSYKHKSNDLLSLKSEDLLFQEYLPGQEWTIDCLVTKNHKLIIPRKRLNIKGGNLKGRNLMKFGLFLAKNVKIDKKFTF